MCEACLTEVGGLDGLHSRVAEVKEERERAAHEARLCSTHKCPACRYNDEKVRVHPGLKLHPTRVRAIEDEWVRDGLIR